MMLKIGHCFEQATDFHKQQPVMEEKKP
jgi:hypothetical protein